MALFQDNMITNQNIEIIKSLVGEEITEANLKFIDCFVSSKLSIFMPVGGSCGYAVTPDHKHPSYMFIISYDHETEVFIDKKKFQSYPNSIFCLSPQIKHHEVQNYLPPKYCAIFIDKDLFESSFKSYSDKLTLFNGLIVDIKGYKLDQQIKDFINETQNIHSSKDIVLDNISILLTHQIIRSILKCTYQESVLTDNQTINEAVKFINIHFEKEITIEELAKVSYLSKSHFTKLFTQEMQVSPMTYLKTIRLQNAKKMLLSKQLSITQVSQQCGFNSTSYFTKLFKDSFNQTPKEFMNITK